MKTAIVSALLGAGVLAAASAHASVIFDAHNFNGEQPFTFSFTATAADTPIAFFGFDVQGFDQVLGISLTTNGGSNLLGQTWSFMPAPMGSNSFQGIDGDGTGTDGLVFAAGTFDSFDEFSQNVATVAGQTYDLNFTFFGLGSGPSEVFATASVAAVPEPATWTLAVLGFGGLGAALRSRRRLALAA
jgi:PEP-CTERM motif